MSFQIGSICFRGFPKADKMELIIQKAVELGACQVIPVETKRCVVRLDGKKAAKKAERWQQIAESAAKQSKRMLIPSVHPVMTFKDALAWAKEMDVRLIPYELAQGMAETKALLSEIRARTVHWYFYRFGREDLRKEKSKRLLTREFLPLLWENGF